MSDIDKATLALVVDLLNRLGKSTDAAGTGTINARLAQIAGYVDQVEGYTDTLETLIGLTGDAANGSGSMMARLAAIRDYVDTLETSATAIKAKTDSIGTNADAVGTTTQFARLRQIAERLDVIGYATDAVGVASLFGKLAALADATTAAAGSGKYMPYNVIPTKIDGTNNVWKSVLDISGKAGYLGLFYTLPTNNGPTTRQSRITADGTVIYLSTDAFGGGSGVGVGTVDEFEFSYANNSIIYAKASWLASASNAPAIGIQDIKPFPNSAGNGIAVVPGKIHFKNSLKIELLSSDATAAYWTYIIRYGLAI